MDSQTLPQADELAMTPNRACPPVDMSLPLPCVSDEESTFSGALTICHCAPALVPAVRRCHIFARHPAL